MSSQAAEGLELASQPEWLRKIADPLNGNGCGEDPRYGDHFGMIKREIDKLKNNDFVRVEELCLEILSTQSKDLRVAGYLLLAATYCSGIAGLIDAVRVYQALIDGYGKNVHPQKESMRVRTLEWLNNGKLEGYARQKMAQAEGFQLRELRLLIASLNQTIRDTYGDSAPCWTSLVAVLDSRLEQLPVAAAPEAPAAPETQPQRNLSLAANTLADAPVELGTITSERDLVTATRAIRDYLLGSNDELRAIAFSRALRWGALQLPPNENRQTRIPAPRQTALNELAQLAGGNHPEALLSLCESLFLEPGGQFLLDLQRIASEAAQSMGRADLAELITQQSLVLVRRLPELPSLQFENDYPFADLSTRNWLEERLLPAAASPVNTEVFTQELEALIENGRKLLRQKQLPGALSLLKECAARDEKQRLQLQLAKARLCLEGGKAGIALPLLEALATQVEAQSLDIWEPELAIEIWSLHIETSQGCLKKASGEEKALLNAAIARLKRQICCTAPEIAARLV